MKKRPDLNDIAQEVSDGQSVDWRGLSSLAEEESQTLEQLQALAAIAEVHREAREDLRRELRSSSDSEEPTLQAWKHLRILDEIGEGSFGRVFRAYDPELEIDVALKLFKSSHEERTQEAKALAQIRHPNVIQVFGAGVDHGMGGIWMELVSGESLADYFQGRHPLAWEEVRSIGMVLLAALEPIHAQGLVHGDIKHANVYRERSGRIVLMDFGAAQRFRDPRSGRSISTPLYAAPEVLEGEPASPKSDLYNVGVLLYYLLTGDYPVRAENLDQLKQAHASDKIISARDRRPKVPASMDQIIEIAIAKVPQDRYSSAREMREALEKLEKTTSSWRSLGGGWKAVCLGVLSLTVVLSLSYEWWGTLLFPKNPSQPSKASTAIAPLSVSAKFLVGEQRLFHRDRVDPGSPLRLELKVEADVYFYLLSHDGTQAHALFPLPRLSVANPLRPGSWLHVPESKDEVGSANYFDSWMLDDIGESERFLLVFSRERLDSLGKTLGELPSPDGVATSLEDEDLAATFRGIEKYTQASPDSKEPFLHRLYRNALPFGEGALTLEAGVSVYRIDFDKK